MKSHGERRGPHIRDATEVGLRGHSLCPHSVSENIRHGRCGKNQTAFKTKLQPSLPLLKCKESGLDWRALNFKCTCG